VVSYWDKGVPFIVCGGDAIVTRRAIATPVEGGALLGPTTFPEWRPELLPGETLKWHAPSASWLVTQPKGKK
jgi:hypothetical protein